MEDESWTGVSYAFICPNCQQSQKQFFTFHDIGYDMEKARLQAVGPGIRCSACKYTISPSQDADLDLVVAPLDRLQKLGYPNPLQ